MFAGFYFISINYLTPSKLNQALPLELNSISILNTHLVTLKLFKINKVNLLTKSSLFVN